MTASGFYHCSVKSVGRANGRSVVAAAAYRSGERIEDERTGTVADYRARGGVVESFIFAPAAAPAWARDRAQLWNAAERAELRANGRLATELELALPCEMDAAQRKQLLKDFLAPIIARHGVAADVAIHAPGKGGDHRNFHAHVLITHRELDADGFGEMSNARTVKKKVKGRFKDVAIYGIAANSADVVALRQQWEQAVNRGYERAGLDIRVDHRSHADRGVEQEPTTHLGPAASAMTRRGAASDRGDNNRDIAERNAVQRLEAEVEALGAAIIAAREGRYDPLHATERRVQRESVEGRYDALREAEPPPEAARVFALAAVRATEPAGPIHDRDAAEAARGAPEARQRPDADEARNDREARAGAAEPSGSPERRPEAENMDAPDKTAAAEPANQNTPEEIERVLEATGATEEAISGGPSPPSGVRSLESVVSGFAASFAAVAEKALAGFFNFFVPEPKLTPEQVHQRLQAAGPVEDRMRREADAEAEAVAAYEGDWRVLERDRAQQAEDLRVATILGLPATAEALLGRDEYERTRAEERQERERDW